jgi:hypothetical protein
MKADIVWLCLAMFQKPIEDAARKMLTVRTRSVRVFRILNQMIMEKGH